MRALSVEVLQELVCCQFDLLVPVEHAVVEAAGDTKARRRASSSCISYSMSDR